MVVSVYLTPVVKWIGIEAKAFRPNEGGGVGEGRGWSRRRRHHYGLSGGHKRLTHFYARGAGDVLYALVL